MSIIQKCISVGIDLQKTVEGSQAILANKNFLDSLNDFEKAIFVPSYHRLPWGMNFRSNKLCVELFKSNIDNEHIGGIIKTVLENQLLATIVQTMEPLIEFVDYLDRTIFQSSVPYTVPSMIHFKPNIVRSIQDLMVECQKIGYIQQIIRRSSDENFMKQIGQYDIIAQQYERKSPCSKEDRKIIKALISKGCSRDDAELIHSFITLKTLIAQTIYDSFMNSIFYLDEENDVLLLKEHKLKNITVMKANLSPDKCSSFNDEKWTLVFHRKDGTFIYGHIYSKTFNFEKQTKKAENIISAVVFHLL